MTESAPRRPRPLSPHLQVYRLPMLALMSITHRITGVALTGGLVIFVMWLIATAMGKDAYAAFHACVTSPLGILFLVGWTLAFYYHLANGVRHLIWDAGWGLQLPAAYSSGRIVLGVALLMTLGTWLCVAEKLGANIVRGVFT